MLFARGGQYRMLRRYPLFYWFCGVSAACYVLKWVCSLTLDPYPDYYRIYILASLPPGGMAAAWLYSVYRKFQGRSVLGVLILPSAAAGIVFAFTPLIEEFQILLCLTNSLFAYVAVLGLWVVGRLLDQQRHYYIGTNHLLTGGGVVFPYAALAINHLAYFSGLDVSIFTHLGEPIYLLSWVVIYGGMRRYDPPKLKSSAIQKEIGREKLDDSMADTFDDGIRRHVCPIPGWPDQRR